MALQLNPYYRTLRTCILENVAGLGKRSAATDPRDEYQACPPLWATCCVRLPGCSVIVVIVPIPINTSTIKESSHIKFRRMLAH